MSTNTTDFLNEAERDAKSLLGAASKVGIANTLYVPNVEDTGFTLGTGEILKAKTINTCVLFIDIRKSTQLNFAHPEETLAKLYATFIRSMLKAAEFFGGKVRNINGDRVMVVFDTADCFLTAMSTATLMNSVASEIIDKYFTQDSFECGIGIDYGKMLVVKTGTVKQGDENQFYKSFVWLGKPANLASKLTDLANKENVLMKVKYWSYNVLGSLLPRGNVLGAFSTSNKPVISEASIDSSEFTEKVTKSSEQAKTKFGFFDVISWEKIPTKSQAILITEEVYKGLKKAHPNSEYFGNSLLSLSNVKVKGYTGKVYGANTIFSR